MFCMILIHYNSLYYCVLIFLISNLMQFSFCLKFIILVFVDRINNYGSVLVLNLDNITNFNCH